MTHGRLPESGFVRIRDLCGDDKPSGVQGILPVTRMTIYRWVKSGKFPRPIYLSPAIAAWPVEEIAAWIKQQKQATEPQQQPELIARRNRKMTEGRRRRHAADRAAADLAQS